MCRVSTDFLIVWWWESGTYLSIWDYNKKTFSHNNFICVSARVCGSACSQLRQNKLQTIKNLRCEHFKLRKMFFSLIRRHTSGCCVCVEFFFHWQRHENAIAKSTSWNIEKVKNFNWHSHTLSQVFLFFSFHFLPYEHWTVNTCTTL